MRTLCLRFLRVIVASALLLWMVVPASAADSDYSDDKLRAFVAAAVVVGDKSSEWCAKIESAASEEEASQLRQQAEQELVQAIDAADDITLEEYNEISVAARADPQLATRFREIYDGQKAE